MFYHFIYLAKGFRMRPKVRSTLSIQTKPRLGLIASLTILRYIKVGLYYWQLTLYNGDVLYAGVLSKLYLLPRFIVVVWVDIASFGPAHEIMVLIT